MRLFHSLIWIMTHLGSLGLLLLVAAGLGHLFLRRHRFHSALERGVFTTALGLSLCALVLFGLGLFGLLYRGVIVGLTIAGALATVVQLVRGQGGQWRARLSQWRAYRRPRVMLTLGLLVLGLIYWGLLLVLSQYPPMDWDAISYHLVLAKTCLAEHRLTIHAGVAVPVTPLLNHLLFVWALALQDDILAQMLEHTFLMLTALGLYAWGRRQAQPALGLAAAAFWLAHPLVLWLSESAYVDLGVTSLALLGIYALRVFWDEGETRWWYLGLALLGAAAGIKMPALAFIAVAAGLGLWACLKARLTWRAWVWGGGLALLVAAPFYAFIAYHTGNPFWPLLPQLSRGIWGGEFTVRWNLGIASLGLPKTLLNFLQVPIQIILHPERFFAERPLFPLIIVWPVTWLIAVRDRSVRWWTGWALVFTFVWFIGSQQLRLWMPALPLAGLAIYESIRWLSDRLKAPLALQRVIWLSLGLWAVWWGGQFALSSIAIKRRPPVTPPAREAFLNTFIDGYRGAKYINEHAAPGDVAYSMNASWLNYYYQVRVFDMTTILDRTLPSLEWPADEPWVRQREAQQVTWLLLYHANPWPKLKTLKENPQYRPAWPPYQLVYEDAQVWVYRRAPAQSASQRVAAP